MTFVRGKEECPGYLEWSAFGARYMDTVCSSVLDWSEVDNAPVATLCDADDNFRPKDVPCPFCDWAGFFDYMWGEEGRFELLWGADESPVAEGTEIHFHDGKSLWWTATHPERGEERVLIREMEFDDE